MKRAFPHAVKNHWGFTLIELMVVIVILGILAGLIVPRIMGRPEQAKQLKARMQIESIGTALKLYKLDNGMYPSTEQGLQALVEPPSSGKHPQKMAQRRISGKGKGAQRPLGKRVYLPEPGHS
jgi:general secretion pathway protein G